ncbi:transmembrane protein [Methylophaga lonarensis MPL]|uniref:Transmembrane protein n=1 Tax=Methylophaga lonarensis MPL TaxID=1286106 RepID=M7NW59_9GAMM|nr:hypothetical protein [Methylophaga lonarensis]EMR13008.1 transmembrane protein [Methylophaga lonarensis MPL]
MADTQLMPENNNKHNAADNQAKMITMVVYGLQAASFLLGITFLVAVIINYIKRDDVAGTWLESHFRWQIRTFWFGLLWAVIGALLTVVFIGVVILLLNAIWLIYRITKGWLYLYENKPM